MPKQNEWESFTDDAAPACKGYGCGIARLYTDLGEPTAGYVRAAMQDHVGASASGIRKALRARWTTAAAWSVPSVRVITRHRAGECNCEEGT